MGTALALEINQPDSTSSSSWLSSLRNIDWKRIVFGNPHLDDSIDPHYFPVSTDELLLQSIGDGMSFVVQSKYSGGRTFDIRSETDEPITIEQLFQGLENQLSEEEGI